MMHEVGFRINKLCKRGGSNINKFTTNRPEILKNLPMVKNSESIKQIEPLGSSHFESTLGIFWCVQNNGLGFRIELKDVPLTRKGVLSTISSIFDPLGIASPFLLRGKRISQQITRDGKD